jgi:hypothetical protein
MHLCDNVAGRLVKCFAQRYSAATEVAGLKNGCLSLRPLDDSRQNFIFGTSALSTVGLSAARVAKLRRDVLGKAADFS